MRKSKVISAGIGYLICNIAIRGLSVLTAPLFNRLLSQADIGDYANIASWVSIISVLVTMELSSSIFNARLDFNEETLSEHISTMLLFGNAITLVLFACCCVFIDQIEVLLSIKREYIYLIFLYLLFYPAISIFTARAQAFLEYKSTIVISAVVSISTVVLSLILVWILPNRLDGRVWGGYVPPIIIGLALYVAFLKRKLTFKIKYIKYACPISIPLMFHLLAGSLLSSSDRIMITEICGNVETALYNVANSLPALVMLVWSSANNAFAPWCFDRFHEGSFDKVKRPAILLLGGFGLLMMIVSLLAPEVLLILGGTAYSSACYVVAPVLCGNLACAAYTFYVNVEQYYKKSSYTATATMIAAVLNIGLNYALLPKYGYVIAAYTTWAGFLAMLIMHYFVTRIILKKNIYHNKAIFVVVLVFSIGIMITQLLYNYYIIRYVLVGCIAIIGMLLLKKIMKKIKNSD